MDKKKIARDSAKILLDTKSILINTQDPFTYTSGKRGPVYVDIRRTLSFPKERRVLMDYAADLLRPLDLDYLAGGETAGIPFAAFIADRLDLPMLYVRKKPKGHGKSSQIEGCMEEPEKEVALVEDLQNRGTSQKVFVDALRDAGARIRHSFVLFSYDIYPEMTGTLKDMGVTLHALTNWWAVLDIVKDGQYFDDQTVRSLESFLNNPEGWTADAA